MRENQAATFLWARLAADRRVFHLVPVLALFIPLFANAYIQFVVNMTLVYVPVTIGFNILIGNLGQLAFANTAFFGIGAYTTGILMAYAGLPFCVSLITGGVMGALA